MASLSPSHTCCAEEFVFLAVPGPPLTLYGSTYDAIRLQCDQSAAVRSTENLPVIRIEGKLSGASGVPGIYIQEKYIFYKLYTNCIFVLHTPATSHDQIMTFSLDPEMKTLLQYY